MDLDLQIATQKRKSTVLSDFVIETTYIKELASQVFNADEQAQQSPAFQGACATLGRLCDTVVSSVQDLKGLLPLDLIRPQIDHPLD